MHRPGRTKGLEGRQPEAGGLVLGEDVADAEFDSECGKGHERCRDVARKAAMERDGLT